MQIIKLVTLKVYFTKEYFTMSKRNRSLALNTAQKKIKIKSP